MLLAMLVQQAPKVLHAMTSNSNYVPAPKLTAPERYAANPINDIATQMLLKEDLFDNLPAEVYEENNEFLNDSDLLHELYYKAAETDDDYNKIPIAAEGTDVGDDIFDSSDPMDEKAKLFKKLIRSK